MSKYESHLMIVSDAIFQLSQRTIRAQAANGADCSAKYFRARSLCSHAKASNRFSLRAQNIMIVSMKRSLIDAE
jgi:hypothetical protein